jgi:outer membrane protein assembly factor BamB
MFESRLLRVALVIILTSMICISCDSVTIIEPPPPWDGLNNIYPPDDAGGVDVGVDLSWDPCGYVEFYVYFGKDVDPPLVAIIEYDGDSQTMFDPGILQYGTTYYWKVVATHPDVDDYSTGIMDFTTTVEGRVIWKRRLGYSAGTWSSSPVVAENVVYVGGREGIYCLDAGTGSTVWSYPGANAGRSDPTVAGGVLYIGDEDGRIYCLDAGVGSVLWVKETGLTIYKAPAVCDGMLYVCANDYESDWDHTGYLICYDSGTGSELWRITYDEGPMNGGPAAAAENVYVTNGIRIYCYDGLTGDDVWERHVIGHVGCRPWVEDNDLFLTTVGDYMYNLDAATGEVDWYTRFDGGWSYSDPYVVGGKVYGCCANGVFCFDAGNGNLIWSYDVFRSPHSGPAVNDNRLYTSVEMHVICLDALTGTFVWEYLTGGDIFSTPAYDNGKVYVTSTDGYLYCLDGSPNPGRYHRSPERLAEKTSVRVPARAYLSNDSEK